MNHRKNTGHSVSSLFSLLLFGVFVLFLILMLLFSARIYQQTVKQTDSDSELGTAATYLTTKFRMIFLPFVSGTISKEKNISRIFT